ncbi:MAG: pyridoxal 5'-phosphate synthase glutaminase subunit PdxT [Myxococcota bacterium]
MNLVGVLALQGDWRTHGEALDAARIPWKPVRVARDLEACRGLVIPGGESTTLLRLLEPTLTSTIERFIETGQPVLATCAGLIIAARDVSPVQRSFGWINIGVRRNGWGRHLDSFVDRNRAFIRAPRIVDAAGVEVLDTVRGEPALVRQGAVLGATFHPELTQDVSVYQLAFGAFL